MDVIDDTAAGGSPDLAFELGVDLVENILEFERQALFSDLNDFQVIRVGLDVGLVVVQGIFQFFFQEIGHFGKQVQSSIASINTVVAVRVKISVELLIGSDQGISHFCGILKVNIVIPHSVYQ